MIKNLPLLAATIALLVSASSSSNPGEDSALRNGIPIQSNAQGDEDLNLWGTATSPPINYLRSSEDFEDLFGASVQKSRPNLSLSTSLHQSACLTFENEHNLQHVVSFEELRIINQLCTFLTNYFAEIGSSADDDNSIEVGSSSGGDKPEESPDAEIVLGIMDRLLTIFNNITSRVETETFNVEQIEMAKEYMERVRRDIHQMKSFLTNTVPQDN